jgi:uncharacterized protein (TIRG00374 family)
MNKFIKIILKFSLAFLLIWLLVRHSLLNFKLLLVIFTKPLLLFDVFALILIIVLLSSRRWYRLNSTQGFGISYKDTFIATYIGLTFNTLLPGSVGGDLIRINYLFKHTPQKKIAGALSVIADRAMGLSGVFFTLGLIGLIYKNLFASSEYLSIFLTLCMWLSFLALLVIFFMLFCERLTLPKWIKNRNLREKLLELALVVRIYRKAPWVIVECIFISIVIQILLAVILVVIGHLLEFNPVAFLHYTIASLITQLASLIPISPGGFGVGEMAFGKTIMQLNPTMPAAYATIYLAFRIINILYCAPGILFFLNIQSHSGVKQVENHAIASNTTG